MLLGKDFRRRHQSGLSAISRGAVGGGRRHHGLAAAHVSLYQPVHGNAPTEIRQNFPHRPALGTGEGKGQAVIKGRHVEIRIGFRLFFLPGGAHQGESRGEYEEFLEDHPLFRQLRLRHGIRLVDGKICPLGRQNAVFLPHLGGQYLLRQVAHRQRLLHQPEQRRVGQSRGQGINGQNAPGGHGLGLRRLEHGVRHAVADEIPAHRAVENVLPAIFQLLGGKAAVEKRHVQPPGGIRHLHLGQVQPLADVAGAGGVHHRGAKTGGDIRLQLFDGNQLRPVLVPSGEMADEIPEGENIQLGKLLCPHLPHALEHCDGVRQFCHGYTSRENL